MGLGYEYCTWEPEAAIVAHDTFPQLAADYDARVDAMRRRHNPNRRPKLKVSLLGGVRGASETPPRNIPHP
eukprot:8444243-Pyramimonas_sp.AAC.1